jgi:DNA-binding Lrp family transcriptional regulator
MVNLRPDKKDYRILAELDLDFRQSFSRIGKNVGLSKNSVALRFSKLKDLMGHNIAGINYLNLDYRMVKIFYSLLNYDDIIEEKIIKETKKNKNILWAARLFGNYDLEICMMVHNLDELISQISKFEQSFLGIIDHKDILLTEREFFHKYSFLHEKNKNITQPLTKTSSIPSLSKTEKKILIILRPSPRETILDISKKSGLTTKTVSDNIKKLKKKGIIIGFFLSLNLNKFNYEVYKLLIQIQNIKDIEKFEKYICSINNIKHISKTLGLWDYEIDLYTKNLSEVHNQIINIKNTFPKVLKRMAIVSHGKRLITNKEGFLRD